MGTMHEDKIEEILRFWFEDIDHSRWFRKDPTFDRELDQRYGELLKLAKGDQLDEWCGSSRGRLALIILLDQFSRNIYRDTPLSFESDAKALQLCLEGIQGGNDAELSPEQRSFFYLPLRHAEDLAMQKLGLEKTRELNAAGYGSDDYALNHLAIIERFGRFPHRNRIIGRESTREELEFLKQPGSSF